MSNDALAIAQVAAASSLSEPHAIQHYLYVSSSEAAVEVAQELRQRGFRTEQRLGADGVNWLVLARHEAVLTEELMASMRRSMEILIASVGGEYDGWEVNVQHQGEHGH